MNTTMQDIQKGAMEILDMHRVVTVLGNNQDWDVHLILISMDGKHVMGDLLLNARTPFWKCTMMVRNEWITGFGEDPIEAINECLGIKY